MTSQTGEVSQIIKKALCTVLVRIVFWLSRSKGGQVGSIGLSWSACFRMNLLQLIISHMKAEKLYVSY